ncbi:unnamed protein product [Orchesella dallaii]|uniref:Uncharacterized protein n=1 Tax=Orchesella dallaii TaxID=48710 RepID=A0ABP1Q4T7_9HEXA
MKGTTVVLLLAIVGIAFAVDAPAGDEAQPATRDARFLGLFGLGLGYGYGGYGGYYGGYRGYGGYGYPYGGYGAYWG